MVRNPHQMISQWTLHLCSPVEALNKRPVVQLHLSGAQIGAVSHGNHYSFKVMLAITTWASIPHKNTTMKDIHR